MIKLYTGDCLDVLKTLPEESVQCVVTSPPYYGLRDYGTAKWEGGDYACDHRQQLGGEGKTSAKQNTSAGTQTIQYRDICAKCGAVRVDNQIGLEETPEEYIAKLVAVFREVRRVLRSDGVVFLNLGDSYASSTSNNGGYSDKSTLAGFTNPNTKGRQANDATIPRKINHGLKPKDLIGIPWRVALALQADGWWLRQDIIWHKPNPMPESVTDRCTKAHEYIFLLTKSARYFWDAEAIKEPGAMREKFGNTGNKQGANRDRNDTNWQDMSIPEDGRNKRSVWTISTKPFSEAHFATFPPDLVEPMIKAGSANGDTILDPFGGAGTVGLVADRLERDAILIELNPDYAEIARRRIVGDSPMFAKVEVMP